MTKEQAFKILGLEQQELLDNQEIQELQTLCIGKRNRLNSVIKSDKKGGKTVKVHNLQALIDN